jgi:endonuclease I
MNKKFAVFFLFLTGFSLSAQPPAGYYDTAIGKSGETLRLALHTIIRNHTSLSYSDLWTAFHTTDVLPDNPDIIWDMYSNCNFTYAADQCVNYNKECDCYNREHSMPKSWFDDQYPMYTDLFHLYPTDGWVNGKRSNFPFGEVGNVTYTGNNGSKLGTARSGLGYSGTVFEPVDEYKGDFARTYFYMTTRYRDKQLDHDNGSAMLSGSRLKGWAVQMLIRWSNEDSVSEKEINRNNAVYALQHNRNPFIDYPELARLIWGADSINSFQPNDGGDDTIHTDSSAIAGMNLSQAMLYPNPATRQLNVTMPVHSKANIVIYNAMGEAMRHAQMNGYSIIIELTGLPAGLYLLKMSEQKQTQIYKFTIYN